MPPRGRALGSVDLGPKPDPTTTCLLCDIRQVTQSELRVLPICYALTSRPCLSNPLHPHYHLHNITIIIPFRRLEK